MKTCKKENFTFTSSLQRNDEIFWTHLINRNVKSKKPEKLQHLFQYLFGFS
jgi:hypothetical protein